MNVRRTDIKHVWTYTDIHKNIWVWDEGRKRAAGVRHLTRDTHFLIALGDSMPFAKKRKIDAGSSITTLHRFFSANSPGTKPSLRVKTETEIIVIDSDEDEVEIVDGPGELLTANNKSIQDDCTAQFAQSDASKNASGSGPVNDAVFPSFGFPTLLQPQTAVPGTDHAAAENPAICGAPAGVRDTKLKTAETVRSPQNDELSFVDSPRPFQSDLAIGMDDWGTGDDEVNLISVREEDDEYAEDDIDAVLEQPRPTDLDKPKPDTAANSKNAFSVLMSSFRESESWQEASIMEDRSIRPTKNNRRNAPFYKVLQGMPIAVDAFRYGKIPNVNAYFLTFVIHTAPYLIIQLILNNQTRPCRSLYKFIFILEEWTYLLLRRNS